MIVSSIEGCCPTFVTTFLIACLIILIIKYFYLPLRKPLPKFKRILFLIAHPDDEVMFFGPVLINLINQLGNHHIYLLCLSPGDHEGKGSQRKNELWLSCERIGISPSNITLLKFDELKDGPDNEWSVDLLTRIIDHHVQSHSIDALITFDKRGVSGHRNHIACFNAVSKLLETPQSAKLVRVFILDSVSMFRKYFLNVIDVFISYYYCEYLYLVTWGQRSHIVASMKCHKSQLTWYRQLYLIFSRYMVVNTLQEAKATTLKPKESNKS